MKIQKLLPAFLILLSLCSCHSTNENVAPDEVKDMPHKIAMFYNLTGMQGPLDVPASKGSKLAFDTIINNYPLLATSVGYVLYDGTSDTKVIFEKASQIKKSEIVGSIGLNDTNMMQAIIPEIQASKKLFVSAGATSPLLPKLCPDYIFLAAFGDNAQAAAAAEYAYDSMGHRNACVIYDKDADYTRLLGKYFKESFTSWGGQIVAEQTFSTNDASISQQLLSLKNANPSPDLIYLAALPTQVPSLIKEIRSFAFHQDIFGGDSFDTKELLESDSELTHVYFTTHVMLDAQTTNPQINKFVNAYIAAYDEYPLNAFAALGYDAVNIVFQAITIAGSFFHEDILKAMTQIKDFPGVTGTISYSENNHVPIKPVTIVGIIGDRRYLKGSFIPKKVPAP